MCRPRQVTDKDGGTDVDSVQVSVSRLVAELLIMC
jgi:hypothetical protein